MCALAVTVNGMSCLPWLRLHLVNEGTGIPAVPVLESPLTPRFPVFREQPLSCSLIDSCST